MCVYAVVVLSGGDYRISSALLGWLLLVAVYGIVVIMNDIADYDIDRLNKRQDIPFAENRITAKELQVIFAGLIIASLLAGFLLGGLVLLWVSLYCFLGWLYSGALALKNRSYLALILLGVCYGVMPWLLGIMVLGAEVAPFFVSVMLASFVFVCGIMPLKDVKDLRGDRVYGKNTLMVLKGAMFVDHFVVTVTTVAYACLVLLLMAREDFMLAIPGVLLLMGNVYLVKGLAMSGGRVRRRNGSAARMLFFLYTCLVWAVSSA